MVPGRIAAIEAKIATMAKSNATVKKAWDAVNKLAGVAVTLRLMKAHVVDRGKNASASKKATLKRVFEYGGQILAETWGSALAIPWLRSSGSPMIEYICAVVAAVAAGFVMFGGERVPFGLPPMAWAVLRGVVLFGGFAALVGATALFGEQGTRDAYQKAILVLVVPQVILYLVFNDSFGMSRRAKVPGQ